MPFASVRAFAPGEALSARKHTSASRRRRSRSNGASHMNSSTVDAPQPGNGGYGSRRTLFYFSDLMHLYFVFELLRRKNLRGMRLLPALDG